ncbi:hypothetical protein B0H16DRAFT_1884179 [Mycena metata]|uniref:Uncharacterized protein n=1 Tax=Mycena metata TaxID=1033252 RepID=A0AAD7NIJ5_9AGAR|nr:hypothetical protein B0H16DRAFT_1884179 [Mycena metata]
MGPTRKRGRRSTGRVRSVSLFLAAFLFLLCMVFKCAAPDCNDTVVTAAGLGRHHTTCQKWLAFNAQGVIQRRERTAASGSTTGNITAALPGGMSRKRPNFADGQRRGSTDFQQHKRRAPQPNAAAGPSRLSPRRSPSPFLPPSDPDLGGGSDNIIMSDVTTNAALESNPEEQLPAAAAPPPPPEEQGGGPPPPEEQEGRRRREIRLPKRFRDILPEPLIPADAAPPEEPAEKRLPTVTLIVRDTFQTLKNRFGLWRSYLHRPTYDPDALINLDDLSNQFPASAPVPTALIPEPPVLPGAANKTTSLLMSWVNNGNAKKSSGEINSLVNDVPRHPDFDVDELKGFDAGRANKQVDLDAQAAFPLLSNFKETSIEIDVPSGSQTVPSKKFAVPELQYRSLVSVIKSAFEDPLSGHFHFAPFKLFHKLRNSVAAPIRVFSELYNSDAYITEHDRIQRHGKIHPDDRGCKREKVIAALMFWSDSTHLANFGTAKLWPIYMLFGNLSKYIRAKPSAGAEHHVAYIPSVGVSDNVTANTSNVTQLPDSIQDEISKFHAKWSTQKDDILTHCRRELMHAVWKYLLDDEFLHAYTYGIVIKCADGVERRVYPRLFTYSADYPEKVLLATIRDGGGCPCPRCLVPKSEAHLMGSARDMTARVKNARKYLGSLVNTARRFIYKFAHGIGSKKVDDLLKETSSVPTLNAFIERLGSDFNLHQMLVVDFMHEFELGVWKNVFTHLIRLLYALPDGKNLVAELDRRYRQMPRFGSSTIRRFSTNASEMNKLGARDLEDLLQCAIPAFDGLFPPEHNERVLKLLYRMAEWHACAKLRMHTDPGTLTHFTKLTPEIGRLMRDFKKTTCAAYKTFELPRETAARGRREQRAAAARAATAPAAVPDPAVSVTPAAAAATPPPPAKSTSRKEKNLNLNTYKFHAMGDYPSTIPLFGPTDIYSSQLGEALHKLVKSLYGLTNKRSHASQIGKRYMRIQRARAAAKSAAHRVKKHAHHVAIGEDDPLGATPPDVHHHTGRARRKPLDIYESFHSRTGDPAIKDFIPKLQDHILGRLLQRGFDGDTHEEFTPADRKTVRIHSNKIYATRTLRVNYTTYDVRRGQDTLNPRTSSFVMIRSPETEAGAHPYWYCQLLGIFHANVFRVTESGATSPTPMEFLWVRWMGVEPGYRAGIKRARLPKVGFVPESDPFAFGFLDPQHVLRGSHLIPDFVGGRTNELLATQEDTAARAPDDTEDWATYCVDIFADRDMFMRYFGGGIGHLDIGPSERMDDDDDDPAAVLQEDEMGAGAATTQSDSSSESEEDTDGDDSGEELDDEDLEADNAEDFGFGAD